MNTYRFNQNNSGGFTVGPDGFVVQAQSVDHAWIELEKKDWFTTDHCECCGLRWSKFDCDMLLPNGKWGVAR